MKFKSLIGWLFLMSLVISVISYILEYKAQDKSMTQISFGLITVFYSILKMPELLKMWNKGLAFNRDGLSWAGYGLLSLLLGNKISFGDYPLYFISKSFFGLLLISNLIKPKEASRVIKH